MEEKNKKFNFKILISIILIIVVVIFIINIKNKHDLMDALDDACMNINLFSVAVEDFITFKASTSEDAEVMISLGNEIETKVEFLKEHEEDYKAQGKGFENSYNKAIEMYELADNLLLRVMALAYGTSSGYSMSSNSIVSTCNEIQELYAEYNK